jgi:hypothetical protein
MQYTNYNLSGDLSNIELGLAVLAKRVPLVLPVSGVKVEHQKVKDGEFTHKLTYGPCNYWFLRHWAAWSLGKADVLEVADYPLGPPLTVRVYDPLIDQAVPSTYFPWHSTVFPSNGSFGKGGAPFSRSDCVASVTSDPETIDGIHVGTIQHAEPFTSAYKVYACDIYSTGTVDSAGVPMPILPVPVTDFEIVHGDTAYKRSKYGGQEQADQLSAAGYYYFIDEVQTHIYYTNSVAVVGGFPPTARSLGLPKLGLTELPQNWTHQLTGDLMPIEV